MSKGIHPLFGFSLAQSPICCAKVCKVLDSIIRESPQIQYRVELFLKQKLDGPLPPTSLTPTERLKLLREHEERWTSLKWARKDSYPLIVPNTVWELASGIFAQALHDRPGIRFHQMPSAIRGTQGSTWELPDLKIIIDDFGMSPAEDLLVVINKYVFGHSSSPCPTQVSKTTNASTVRMRVSASTHPKDWSGAPKSTTRPTRIHP